jgi:uncharacterized lipoprotein YbaY
MRTAIAISLLLALVFFAAQAIVAQEPQPPSTAPGQETPQNDLRRAIRWKQFEYTCDGGGKVFVWLTESQAKVTFQDRQYLLRQTPSADGERYSDGKTVWWGKGEGGFLQEDTSDGNGKMLAANCKLDSPSPAQTGELTGTVTYRQKVALPPEAIIEVKLRELPVADARERAKLIAQEKITLGNRQVPVPFELKFDPARINSSRAYDVTARILVAGNMRFYSGHGYLVLTQSHPSHVDMTLDQTGAGAHGSQ